MSLWPRAAVRKSVRSMVPISFSHEQDQDRRHAAILGSPRLNSDRNLFHDENN